MPKALSSELSIIDDLVSEFPIHGQYQPVWMIKHPLAVLWADTILVPKRLATSGQNFNIDVEFQKSNDVLTETMNYAWDLLVCEGVIQSIPVTAESREASSIVCYAVRNRIEQTRQGHLTKLRVKAPLKPLKPTDTLQIDDVNYCENHLDAAAVAVVAAHTNNAVWLADRSESKVFSWLYSGGLDPRAATVKASEAILTALPRLRIPKMEFIPPVLSCNFCGHRGQDCYSDDYGPKEWINGSKYRLHRLLELRQKPEVKALRRMLDEVTETLQNSGDPSYVLDQKAGDALTEAAAKAAYRVHELDESVKTICDLIELYSYPLAIFGALTESSMLGAIGTIAAGASKAISVGCETLLVKPHRWIELRQVDLDKPE